MKWLGFAAILAGSVFASPVSAVSATWPPSVPSSLSLTVRDTAGIARTAEVVTSGIPLPRSLGVLDASSLTVVNAASQPVPAEFHVLARWNAARTDTSAPIQWLLVSFPASVAAGGSSTHRIVTDGSAGPNPAPAQPLTINTSGNQVTVDTSAAVFTIGGDSGALFDQIRLANGTIVVTGSDMTARIGVSDSAHSTTRRVRVERSGPLTAVVVIEGAYAMSPVGGGGLGSTRRYVFTAGSPTALVRHAVAWEGDLCGAGNLSCGPGSPNGLRLEGIRAALDLGLGQPRSVQVVGAFASPAATGTVAASQEASVRQLLRSARTDALSFQVSVPGSSPASGIKADGGMLVAGTASGAAAAAVARMHRYEPQALRLLADGRLAIDVADGPVWLGVRQGLFAQLAVGALPPNPTRADLDRRVWAPLNRPLRAWASPEWLAASGAVDEFPVGGLPSDLQGYDTLVSQVLDRTLAKVDEKGLPGLMTYGLFPREWGLFFDEIDCGDDPTPADDWDDKYWCATWTDYHNTSAAAAVRAMRTGEVAWLDEISVPAALRMLHTQVMQCSPTDPWFYCGQAPAGYGGYRVNFNSSHAYFENLFLYYWLTGDSTVVETLRRGAATMRSYLCARRPAAPCLATDPPTDEWAQLTGRAAMQWIETFRFLGLADDAGYLDDWRSSLARAATLHHVEAIQGGNTYGFWMTGNDVVDGPGTDSTDQLWMATLYDMNTLYRLERDTLDASIGSPLLAPSGIQESWARTLADFGSTAAPGGNGTSTGDWPNALFFTWTGSRIGGTLVGTAANTGGGDPLLYPSGKATLAAAMARAADATGDAALSTLAGDLTRQAIAQATAETLPLGKANGIYLSRLHSAVARLGLQTPPEPLDFYTLPPCRIVDTRSGPPLASGTSQTLGVAGTCGIPASAKAVAANLTAVASTGQGNFVAWPAGSAPPTASVLNFSVGQTRANNVLLSLGNDGLTLRPFVAGAGTVHLLLDVSGWFE